MHTLLINLIGRCRPKFYQQVHRRKVLAYSHRPTRHPRRSSPVASVVATVKPTFVRLGRSTFRRTCRRLRGPPSGTTYQTRLVTT